MTGFFPRDEAGPTPALADVRQHYESVLPGVLRIVWRRRWLVLAVVAAAVVVAVGATTLLLDRQYGAHTLVKVDVGRGDPSISGERAANLTIDAAAVVESEARIIRSRAIARRVVARLDLVHDPEFASRPYLQTQARAAWNWIEAVLLGPLPSADGIVDPAEPDPAITADLVALALLKRLSVTNDSRSYLIDIGVRAGSPESAAAIANAFAEEYLQGRIEASVAAAGRQSEWLAAQLVEQRRELGATDAALQAQRERTGMVDAGAEGANVVQQQLREATAQWSAAVATRQAEEARLGRARSLSGTASRPIDVDLPAYPSLTRLIEAEAQGLRELADLSSRFGERHPQIRRVRGMIDDLREQIAREKESAIAGFEVRVNAARTAEQALERRVASLGQARIGAKPEETTLRDLQLQADRVRERVRSLADSYAQAVALKELKPLNAQVVVRAEPEAWPISPRPMLILGFAVMGALGAGIALALLLDRRDGGFRTAGEVPAATGSRCLGMLPELSPRAAGRVGDIGTNTGATNAMFREGIGAIGALIGPASAHSRATGANPMRMEQVVLVTSSVPREGKSLLVAALAHTLVGRGLRVLMIDGDPQAVTAGEPPATYGLRDVYEGDDAGRGFFGRREGDALLVLDRAAAPRNVPNGFNCRAFEAMLHEARSRYDVVLIEGPPVMLMADSLVLGRNADLVIHAARWRHTPRRTVAAALGRLRDLAIPVAGVVLMGVDMKAHAKYSFFDECHFYRQYQEFYRGAFR